MKFTPRQIVVMVVAASAALIFMPVAVGAATGSLVNITDPFTASRKARVSSAGALLVESRGGVPHEAFNVNQSRLGLGYISLASATMPKRIAITEVTITGQGPAGSQEVLIEAFVRISGSAGCGGPGTPGYSRFTLRRIAVENGKTVQVQFAGLPLMLPVGASGQPTCFGATVISIPSGSATYVGGTGYRFTA